MKYFVVVVGIKVSWSKEPYMRSFLVEGADATTKEESVKWAVGKCDRADEIYNVWAFEVDGDHLVAPSWWS